MEKNEVMLKIRIDKELRDKFKAYCAVKGTSMTEILTNYIDITLEDYKNEK